MEGNFKEIFEHFGVSAIWITIFMSIMRVVIYFKPVTFLTSSEVEKSLAIKETRFAHASVMYIFYTIGLAIFLFGIGTVLTKINYNVIPLVILATILYAFFFYYLNEKDKQENLTLIKIVLALMYMTGWVLVFSYFLSGVLSIETPPQEKYISYIGAAIFALIVAGLLILVCQPALKTLQLSQKKYVYFEDENKKNWYILYSLNKEEVMIGDQSLVATCTEFKIIKKEEIKNLVFKIASATVLKIDQEKPLDLIGSSHFLITMSLDLPMKVEICIKNKPSIFLSDEVGPQNIKEARRIIAKYISGQMEELPIMDAEIEVVECLRKIRENEQQDIWSKWRVKEYLMD